jgi:hypothetical protein
VAPENVKGIAASARTRRLYLTTMVEVVYSGGKPVRAGDQFGVGRKR